MNREQRRKAQREHGKLVMVNLSDITYPWQMSVTECETMLAHRLMGNLAETGHPFHHLTANGSIVEPDPTLDYYLSRLTPEKQETVRANWQTRIVPDAPAAVPVNRKFYGHDPYERH